MALRNELGRPDAGPVTRRFPILGRFADKEGLESEQSGWATRHGFCDQVKRSFLAAIQLIRNSNTPCRNREMFVEP